MFRTLVMLGGVLGLAACSSVAPFKDKLPLAQGPKPEITGVLPQGKLACVAAHLTPRERSIPFGVIAAPDRTGKINIAGNDSTGRFNTEGAADMITSSLGRTGVRIVELGPEYRNVLDWSLNKAMAGFTGDGVKRLGTEIEKKPDGGEKEVQVQMPNIPARKGTVFPVRYGIYGAITSTDFIPGGGASAGIGGVGASYSQNRAHVRIDLRAIKMPVGDAVGGEVVATTTIEKQMVNDDIELQLSRYFGPATSPTLINFGAGSQQREAWQLSTGAMLDLGVADLMEQIFKITPCSHTTVAAL